MSNEKEYIRHGFGDVRPYLYGHLDLPEFVKRAFGVVEYNENRKSPVSVSERYFL
jgi:PhnB protein